MNPCRCSVCSHVRALRDLRDATDRLSEATEGISESWEENGMALAYLRDEVAEAAKGWRGRLVRRRLLAALRVAEPLSIHPSPPEAAV